jgi:methyltransferase-like protein
VPNNDDVLQAVQQSVNSQTQCFNRLQKQCVDLRQYTSADGQRYVQDKQKSLDQRWRELNQLLTDNVSRYTLENTNDLCSVASFVHVSCRFSSIRIFILKAIDLDS